MSPEHDASATDEVGSIPIGAAEIAAGQVKETARSFLQSARRDLSDEELAAPAARRFLIADLERLDQTCADLEGFRDKYNDQRVTIAILSEAQKAARWHEILSATCLAVGSAGLGAAPSYFSIKDGIPLALVVLALSVVLFGAGVISRIFK